MWWIQSFEIALLLKRYSNAGLLCFNAKIRYFNNTKTASFCLERPSLQTFYGSAIKDMNLHKENCLLNLFSYKMAFSPSKTILKILIHLVRWI